MDSAAVLRQGRDTDVPFDVPEGVADAQDVRRGLRPAGPRLRPSGRRRRPLAGKARVSTEGRARTVTFLMVYWHIINQYELM